jgi:hypothetical protein
VKTSDLIEVKLPILVGDRKFQVRQVRLCDVLRILVRFDDQVRAFVASEKPDARALLSSLDNDDTADLFAFFLDPYDPLHLRKNLDLVKRSEVLVMIQAVNDVERIWSSLRIGNLAADPQKGVIEPVGAATQIPPMVRVVDLLARRYYTTPFAVMRWPYEAFLTIVEMVEDAMNTVRAASEGSGVELPDGSLLDWDLLDDSNIPVGPMPDLNKVN